MINLIITNESYKKIKTFLEGSVKFFLVEKQNHYYIIKVKSVNGYG